MHLGPGTRALVTGSSRGIGRALAERLAARGVTVGLAARTTRELEALADALPGEHVVLGGTDVADRASVGGAVERFGRIDLLVANAGIAHHEPFAEQSAEHVEEMTQTNWLGTLHTVTSALPAMLRQRSGHVVVVCGAAALRPAPRSAVFGATKAAQRAFATSLRQELEGTGVSVTAAFPGDTGPAHRVADRILRAVERDEREVFDAVLTRLGARA